MTTAPASPAPVASSSVARPDSATPRSRATTKSAPSRDHRTQALVLRRVNYGEADRILDLITPAGLVAVLAKSVRKEKSKLAGGVELFCLSEITYHEGRSSLATLTGAKMLNFYSRLLADYDRLELASRLLKSVRKAALSAPSPDFFTLTQSSLSALDSGTAPALVELYFTLNLARISGEDPNFYFDTSGHKLAPGQDYLWDTAELAFAPTTGFATAAASGFTSPSPPLPASGTAPQPPLSTASPSRLPQSTADLDDIAITTDDIKLLRLMLTSPLALVLRARYDWSRLPRFRPIVETFAGR